MRNLDLKDPRVLEDSLVVSASAGSGKTFTLTVLVTASLGREELRPFEILATTFSEAATGDLRERLLRPLDLLASLDPDAWKALLPLLGNPDTEAIEALLEALPLPSRLAKSGKEVAQAAPLWTACAWAENPLRAQAFWRRTRREAELLQVSTIHSLALSLLRQGEGAPEAILDAAHPALLRLLRQTVREALTLPETHPDHGPARMLLAWAEANWEALSSGHDGHRDAMGHLEPEDLAPLRAALLASLARAEAALEPFAQEPLRAMDETSGQRRHFKASCILPIPGPSADLTRRIRWAEKQSRSVDAAKTYFTTEFREALKAFGSVSDAWEAWLRGLLVDALRRFELQKVEHGQATFGDLVRKALHGLERGELEAPSPRLLLVDEYQDTSRAQDAFLTALGAARTVRVGDLKQAIYGFRGGDPELLREHLAAAGERAFRLPSNFRSAPPVVALANRLVEEVWPWLDPQARNLDGRQEALGSSTLPVGLVRSLAPSRGADLPALADWIAALSLEEGWRATLGEAGGGRRRRALLLRQRTKLPVLLQRLKKKGIQPYVVAKEGFWDSPGVRLVMAALEAVAHPERPLPCAALLRNIVGLSDGELTALGRSGLPGLGLLDPERLPENYREAARWLLELRNGATQEIAGRLLMQGSLLRTLRALRAHGAMEPLRARRNLAGLLAMLLELPASPTAAYARLEEERAGRERGDLPASAEGADLLIQTVHGSKGLEYDDVILPLLNSNPQSFRRGELRTDPVTGALALAWKLGNHPGAAYRTHKPLVEARQRRDDLNLLYVACTRARERMCLLLQEPEKPKEPLDSKTWAQFGHHLAAAHTELLALQGPPDVPPSVPPVVEVLAAPIVREALREEAEPFEASSENRTRARQEGEAMHAFLRDLLVRWEDPEAFAACLDAAPAIGQARENALRFLEQFEARGWRHLRRRTELPLVGAAASGALGRADLVVWEEDRIHLLDFKHSKSFGEVEWLGYRAQLKRYAEVLVAAEALPVEAWLVALKSGDWVRVD
jgi:ATP-dependent exoDNAse (exonuclease V) beta subunit